jgi:acetolactate synthase I/II/III large subunit
VDVAELASITAKSLVAAGAKLLVGLPGGGNNLELVGAAEVAGIRFVLTHTEAAAAYTAAVHFEVTGTPTGCVVTRGPGAASAVNGVAQAWLDRQPLLLFTDTVAASDVRRIAHQRLDQHALFAPITKRSTTLDPAEPAAALQRAIDLALAPAPGPVHLDIDPTVAASPSPPDRMPAPAHKRQELTEANRILARSSRPVVLLGTGAVPVTAKVRSLLEGTGIPVLQTYKAKGIVPDSWPNSAGTLTGATIEAPVIEAADVIVAIGLDTVELIPNPWPYTAPVLSLAAWQDKARYFTPAAESIGPLDELLDDLGALPDGWDPGFARAARRSAVGRLLSAPRSSGLAPTTVVRTVGAAAPAGSSATVDSGAHMLAAMELWDAEQPHEVLISSGLATMGFALPAAIATALARPDRRTFCLVGDGGLGMVLAELETVARLRLPITIVVFNDSTLSLIKLKQKPHGHGGTAAVEYRPTDFARIAEATGIPAHRVSTESELDTVIRQALGHDGPALIDAIVNPVEYPHILSAIRGGR